MPPPPSVWLHLQATAQKLPQNLLCPSFIMAKTFSAPPPLFVGIKLHMPPLPFCSPPPPLPVISDQSLRNIFHFPEEAVWGSQYSPRLLYCPLGRGQYDGKGVYCGLSTAFEVFLTFNYYPARSISLYHNAMIFIS